MVVLMSTLLASRPSKPPAIRSFVYGHTLFVGSRAALCLVWWRAGTSDWWRMVKCVARCTALLLRLRDCHTGSSNKCEPYDFAVNGEGDFAF